MPPLALMTFYFLSPLFSVKHFCQVSIKARLYRLVYTLHLGEFLYNINTHCTQPAVIWSRSASISRHSIQSMFSYIYC